MNNIADRQVSRRTPAEVNPISIVIFLRGHVERYEEVYSHRQAEHLCRFYSGLRWQHL